MTTEPKWMQIARTYMGTREIPGPKHNTTIQGWLARLGAWWRDDETPWCGVFVAHCMRETGLPVPTNWMRAKSWADYGSNLRSTFVAPGAILVFSRQGGGHVGFYAGEDASNFYVLGGNQGNEVNISRISKARCVAIRWPKGEPVVGGPRQMSLNVNKTTNEA